MSLPAHFAQEHIPWLSGLLQAALRPEAQADAARLLEACECVPGFARLVSALAIEPSSPLSIPARLMASICCKNIVLRHWTAASRRSQSPVAPLPEADRAALREQFMGAALSEPDDALAAQWLLAVAKISRTDWPRAWPSCFTVAVEACRVRIGAVLREPPSAATDVQASATYLAL
jgi:hypothetical protein